MKTIYDIAKAELQSLFYSPIAWLILIIFAIQASIFYCGALEMMVNREVMGRESSYITLSIMGGWSGLFVAVQGYLYLYIPLLTMNLMSRELGSGSIKLLYSSPVTNFQIILGKYLSMLIYGLVIVAMLLLYVACTACVVKDADIPLMLSGVLGTYLLICAYAAIGLFMSSITSYQVIAAVGTLAILAGLTYVKNLWQDIEIVRDLTYWLAIPGRAESFVSGLICSEDVIYFIIVVALFLSLTIIRLQARRQKSSGLLTWGKYLGVWIIALFLGYLSSRPKLMSYADVTSTKMNTLTPNSQELVRQMKGGLTITTYVNLLDDKHWLALPGSVIQDMKVFRQYVRFKPEIKMKYVYYYDNANSSPLSEGEMETVRKIVKLNKLDSTKILKPEQIRQLVDLSGEKNRFVRILERENGEKTFLRIFNDMFVQPGESEISVAFKRMLMKLPKVGFLTGHGERSTIREGERDYSMFTQEKPFRYSLINQGFDFVNVTLDKEIPSDINILIVAEMRQVLAESEKQYLDEYIHRGGNLVIMGEPGRQDVMNPLVEPFGVSFMPGCLVRPSGDLAADLIQAYPTKEGREFSYFFDNMVRYNSVITMPSTSGLEYTTDKGFNVIPLFRTDTINCWNELETTNFVDDTAKINPAIGEVEKTYITALALSRKLGEKEQKILVFGDADCISNREFSLQRKGVQSSNFAIIQAGFLWLSNGEVPIDVRRPAPTDNKIYIGEKGMKVTNYLFVGGLPVILLAMILLIWFRRRGR